MIATGPGAFDVMPPCRIGPDVVPQRQRAPRTAGTVPGPIQRLACLGLWRRERSFIVRSTQSVVACLLVVGALEERAWSVTTATSRSCSPARR